MAKESYAALGSCDYLRAHVAARECLKFDKKSVEGALALAVACASFGQIPTVIKLLAFIQKQTGFKTFSATWGAAWAALLAGDWIRAEAMLEKALKLQPQQTALVSLLAIAQSRRGKLQSAIMNARLACEAEPRSKEKLNFLIARLDQHLAIVISQTWRRSANISFGSSPCNCFCGLRQSEERRCDRNPSLS